MSSLKPTTQKLLQVSKALRKKLPRRKPHFRQLRAKLLREDWSNKIRKLYLTGEILKGGFW